MNYIEDKDLLQLDPIKATDYFRRLLWAEAKIQGIPSSLIQCSMAITTPDGGLDVYIKDCKPKYPSFIPNGISGYQIKTGSLSPLDCKKELHVKKKIDMEIRPLIKSILEKNGTYVLVLFQNLNAKEIEERLIELKSDLKKNGIQNNNIEIYSVSQINGFSEKHISLQAFLKPHILCVQHFDQWSKNNDVCFPKKYVENKERKEIINQIRKELEESVSKKLRVTGRSGLGKTRLVYEALNTDNLCNLVVYTSNSNIFIKSQFYNRLKNTNDLNLILVLDDCNFENSKKVANLLGKRGSQFKLITIGLEEEKSDLCRNFNLTPLTRENLEEILNSIISHLSDDILNEIVLQSDGFPKISVELLKIYKSKPHLIEEDMNIHTPDIIMDRLMAGDLSLDSPDFIKLRKILTFISIFGDLGFSGTLHDERLAAEERIGFPLTPYNNVDIRLSEESKWLANELNEDWYEFEEILTNQIHKGILVGKNRLRISPYPLHKHLISRWWENYGSNALDFLEKIPDPVMIIKFFASLHLINFSREDGIYEKITSFLKDCLNKAIYFNQISFLIIDKYNFFDSGFRNLILENLVSKNKIKISSLLRGYKKIPEMELLQWVTKLFNHDQSHEYFSQEIHLSFPNLSQNLRLNLLKLLLNYINESDVLINVIKIILQFFNELSGEIQEVILDQLTKIDDIEILHHITSLRFEGLPEDFLLHILNILLKKEDIRPLRNFLFQWYEILPKNRINKILLALSETEGTSKFFFYFLSMHKNKMNQDLISSIVTNILGHKDNETKIYRKTFIKFQKKQNADNGDNMKEVILDDGAIEKEKTENTLLLRTMLNFLYQKYSYFQGLNSRFRPKSLKVLFLAKGITPLSRAEDVYFYNYISNNNDLLFTSIVSAIYGDPKIGSAKERQNRLKDFCNDGFYVEDVFPMKIPDDEDYYFKVWFTEVYIDRIKNLLLDQKDALIIIIGKSLYEFIFKSLLENGYKVNKKKIPFPNDKNIQTFKEYLQNILEDCQ